MESLNLQISSPSIPEDVRRHMGDIVDNLKEVVRGSTSFSRLTGGEDVQVDKLKEGLEAMVNVVQKMSSTLADHQQLVTRFERLASGIGGGGNADFRDLVRRMDVPSAGSPGGPTRPGEQDTTELDPQEVRRRAGAGGETPGANEDQAQQRVDQMLDQMEQRMEQQLANIAIAYTQKLEGIINNANQATMNAIRNSTISVADNFRNLASHSNPPRQGSQGGSQESSPGGQDSPTGGSPGSGNAGTRGGEGDESGQPGTRGGGGDSGSGGDARGSQGGGDRHIPVWIMNPYINIRGGTGGGSRRGQPQQDPVDEATQQANEQDDRSEAGTRGGVRPGAGRRRVTDPNEYYNNLLEKRHMREIHPANLIPNALEGALDLFTPGGAPAGRHYTMMAQFATQMIGRAAYSRLRGSGGGGLAGGASGAGEAAEGAEGAAAGAGEAAGAAEAGAGAAGAAEGVAAGAGAAEAGAAAGLGEAAGGAALGGPAGLLGGLLLYGGSKIVGAVGHQYFDNLAWQQKQLGRFGLGEEQLNPLSMAVGQTPTDKLFRAETETRLTHPSLSGEQIDKLTEASAKLGNTASQAADMLNPAADAMTRFGIQGQFAIHMMTAGSLTNRNDPTGTQALAGYEGVREAAAQRGLPGQTSDQIVEQSMQTLQDRTGTGAASQLGQTAATATSNLRQDVQKEIENRGDTNPFTKVQQAVAASPTLQSAFGEPGALTDPNLRDPKSGELTPKGIEMTNRAASRFLKQIARMAGYDGTHMTTYNISQAQSIAAGYGIHMSGLEILQAASQGSDNLQNSLAQTQQTQQQAQQGNVPGTRSAAPAQGGQGGAGGFLANVASGIANGIAGVSPMFSALKDLIPEALGGGQGGRDATPTAAGVTGAGTPAPSTDATPAAGAAGAGSTPQNLPNIMGQTQNQAYVTDQGGNQIPTGSGAAVGGGVSQQALHMAGVTDASKATPAQMTMAQGFERILQGIAKPPATIEGFGLYPGLTGAGAAGAAEAPSPFSPFTSAERPMGTTTSPSFLQKVASGIPVVGPLLSNLMGGSPTASTPASASGAVPAIAQAGKGTQQAPVAHVEITASKKLQRLFHFRNMADGDTAGGEVSKGQTAVRQDGGGKMFGGPLQ